MSVQLLISTLNNKNYENLIEKMNIQTDAVIVNQCDRHSYKELNYRNNTIQIYEFAERGVGLSRSTALMRANADYCLISDDDMTYVDGYEGIVERVFLENKDADVIIFGLYGDGISKINRKFKIKYHNYMRFGAARIAIRYSAIKKCGIFFNLNYGGGTSHGSGEDSLFLKDCIKKGLKIYAVPDYIATLNNERESTWFNGYNEKYFIDKGHLFACISKRYSLIIGFLNIVKNRSTTKDVGFWKAFKYMRKGIKEYNKE